MIEITLSALAELIPKLGEWALDFLNKGKGRISIKEIKRKTDRDISEALELYERLFPEEHRIPASDLVRWLHIHLPPEERANSIEHCFLIAKLKGKVVGLLKTLYCPECHLVLVSYFGIDKGELIARKVASKMILGLFNRFLDERWDSCAGILFETESEQKGLAKAINQARRAKIRLFKDIAR